MHLPSASQRTRFFRVLCLFIIALAGSARAAVVINEILYRAGTNYPEDTGKEWVELRNTGGASVDVSGWQFNKGINFTFANGTTIPANGYLVVVANTAKFTADFPGITLLRITAVNPLSCEILRLPTRTDKTGASPPTPSDRPVRRILQRRQTSRH